MLNPVENLLENERDPRSGPMNDHSLSLSDPDRSLALSRFLANFLQNLASCHTAFTNRNTASWFDHHYFSLFFRHCPSCRLDTIVIDLLNIYYFISYCPIGVPLHYQFESGR
jgi:hypothetical protein